MRGHPPQPNDAVHEHRDRPTRGADVAVPLGWDLAAPDSGAGCRPRDRPHAGTDNHIGRYGLIVDADPDG